MKLSYSTLACPEWTIEQAVAAAVRYGYTGIEWRLADGEVITSRTPQATLERMAGACASAGIDIVCLDTDCVLVQHDEESRAAVLEEARILAAAARRLGAPLIRVFPGRIPHGLARNDALTSAAQTLRRIVEVAAAQGVETVLENHDDWSATAHVAALLEEAGRREARALWDTQHSLRAGEAAERSLRILGSRIAHVHLKDGLCTSGGWEHRLPGRGEVPLLYIANALRDVGYRGWLSFEWERKWQPALAEPEVALPAFVQTLRG